MSATSSPFTTGDYVRSWAHLSSPDAPQAARVRSEQPYDIIDLTAPPEKSSATPRQGGFQDGADDDAMPSVPTPTSFASSPPPPAQSSLYATSPPPRNGGAGRDGDPASVEYCHGLPTCSYIAPAAPGADAYRQRGDGHETAELELDINMRLPLPPPGSTLQGYVSQILAPLLQHYDYVYCHQGRIRPSYIQSTTKNYHIIVDIQPCQPLPPTS